MFYIHGGAFLAGTGANPEYDGGNLVSRGDVVVVTINYRLGVFGFLSLDDNSTRGNYGIADQVIALDWVRANIAAFGGDPDRITVFGQSAGANSIRAILGSPKAIGKFAAAMPLSHVAGLGLLGSSYTTYPTIVEAAASIVDTVLLPTNCSSAKSQVDCLRDLDAQDLLLSTAGMMP
jgi:carboxylesterase type B